MTKKLEELLDLPPMAPIEEDVEYIEPVDEKELDKSELMIEARGVLQALDNSEKVDLALTSVSGLDEHDVEMDDIADKALSVFKDLTDLGQNISDAHTGKVYEVAATMLKTALDAKDAKVNKKLKMIDLQLKKLKLDKEDGKGGSTNDTTPEFDRNELLHHIIEAQKSEDSDK